MTVDTSRACGVMATDNLLTNVRKELGAEPLKIRNHTAVIYLRYSTAQQENDISKKDATVSRQKSPLTRFPHFLPAISRFATKCSTTQ
jgi:hypothetical protein